MKQDMKHKLKLITSASVASLLALAALGQETINQPIAQTGATPQSGIETRADQLSGAAKTSAVIGMTVNNLQDEKLGKVSDLAVDLESGRVVQVIIATGGFLGMGSALKAVPPGALQHDIAKNVLHLDASKEKLKNAPRFDAAKWDEATQSNRVSEVYGYYGQQPYFVRDEYGTTNTDTSAALANSLPRNMDGTINTAGARSAETAHNVDVARNVEEQNNHISTRNPDGTWKRTYYSNGNRENSSWSNLGYVQKASKLMGAAVNNLQDEKIGTVKNVIVDLSAGRIVAVIISAGGYMGMNGELSAVPATVLKFNTEHNALQLDASKEMLANSPHLKSNEWPDFNQSGYAGGVYHAYNAEPYFSTDSTAQPDNTARNVRDRNSRTLTPLDQGNSQADVSTTAQIRKEIIATKGMTTNAKNVKIITLNGRVTLRGPVNTADEKSRISEIADSIASAGNVDNQLEVSTTPSSN